jgi:hypothetical protein
LPDLPQAPLARGAALHLEGKGDEAIAQFRIAAALDPKSPQAHQALGAALMTRGRCREASLRRCLDLLPATDPQRPTARQLWQLCNQLLAFEPRLPVVLQGKEEPAAGLECFQFAELCYYKQEYATSARLFAAAFARTLGLASDPWTSNRYTAAGAAVRAGGSEAGLSEKERARWREQTREWLRAELTAWSGLMKNGTEDTRVRARQALARWRKDPHLAGLRDAAALAKLPADERRKCQSLWRDVDALLKDAPPEK